MRKLILACASITACASPEPETRTAASALVAGPGVPDRAWPASDLHRRISPIMGRRPFNQPGVVNGTLFLAGNAEHEMWNVSNPLAPVRMSELTSPHHDGEAESHQVSFARFEDGSLHAVTISGRGVDLWNISDPSSPVLDSSVILQGVDYGDFTEAVWGVFWQGHHIFVGGTNTGLHVIDATDPRQPRVVRRVGSTALGGVSAGPLFAMGNLLVVTTPKENGGIATLDIGTPDDPLLLDAENIAPDSYIGGFFGIHAHLLSPFRSYDVLTDPTDIRLVASAPTPATEYMSFADGHVLLGSLRRTAGGVTGILEYDLANLAAPTQLAHVRGRDAISDDQFSIALGNLLVVADDERGYGAYLAVRAADPDTVAPSVIAVHPAPGSTDLPLTTRVGVSFSDVIELTSVSTASVQLRPVGGAAVAGRFGLAGTVLSFSPSAPLLPSTTYELVVDAVTDFVGNRIAQPYTATFTTRAPGAGALPCAVSRPTPSTVGAAATLAASSPDEARFTYEWSFGDGTRGQGASVSHVYAAPGRHAVAVTVMERPSPSGRYDRYEAEEATLAGGVRDDDGNAGFSGTGYADFPTLAGNASVRWPDVRALRAGGHEIVVRYANGDNGARRLELVVNGTVAGPVDFPSTGAWTTWSEVRTPLTLASGLNTVELRSIGRAGPNVDRLDVSLLRASTCSAIQIVSRPITAGAAAPRSGTIVASAGKVWIASSDHAAIQVLEGASMRAIALPGKARAVAEGSGGKVWVTTVEPDAVHVIDAAREALEHSVPLRPGSQPHGVAIDRGRVLVALELTGQLVVLDEGTRAVTRTVDLGGFVRGLAVRGDRVFVARFVSPTDHGEVYEVDAPTGRVVATRRLAESTLADTPDEGRGVPNYLSGVTINPDGSELWIPSKQDNTRRGGRRDGEALTHDATVRPIVSRIDLASGDEAIARRIDLNDASMPVAIEISPLGDLLFIALQGNGKVEVRDAFNGRIVGSLSVGRAPDGLVLDGDRLYVHDFLDRTVTVADVSGFLSGTDSVAQIIGTHRFPSPEPLDPQVLRGKQLFYDASDRRLAKEGYISCASCHLDGREDGRVWDFSDRGEGFRNTISLEGRAGTGHGRVHWSANFDEIQDFEHDIRGPFGGSGLMSDEEFNAGTRSDALGDPKAGVSADLDALAAYVTSLVRVPNSPHRAPDGSLTPDGVLGKAVFFESGCAECHAPGIFADGQSYDVGTLKPTSGMRRASTLEGIDTPTLLGVFATPPYYHDGSAPTLEAVLENATHMGTPLDAEEKRVLVAYLMQLDERERSAMPMPTPTPSPSPSMTPSPSPSPSMTPAPIPAAPVAGDPPADGCGCTTSSPAAGLPWALLLAGLALRAALRR